jgi:hypothetical protein
MKQDDTAPGSTLTTSSTTFVDIGGTGLPWTVSIGTSGDYLLCVDISFYVTGAIGIAYFQVVGDAGSTVTNPTSGSQLGMNTLTDHRAKSWRVPVRFSTTGNHTTSIRS